jgi:hypothetical protein
MGLDQSGSAPRVASPSVTASWGLAVALITARIGFAHQTWLRREAPRAHSSRTPCLVRLMALHTDSRPKRFSASRASRIAHWSRRFVTTFHAFEHRRIPKLCRSDAPMPERGIPAFDACVATLGGAVPWSSL